MNLSAPPHSRHHILEELMPSVHDLVTAAAERHHVLPAVVGGVLVDVMPVEPLPLAAPLARLWLGEHAAGLPAADVMPSQGELFDLQGGAA